MIIAMTLQISGGRSDDRSWPPPGVPFEVTQEEGEGSVRSHSAVDVTELVSLDDLAPHLRLRPGYVTPPAPVSLSAQNTEPVIAESPPLSPEPDSVRLPEGWQPAEPPEPETPADAEPDEADPPKPADPKQAWIDYAVTQGLAEDQAAAMTKVDLMSRFGGRL